LKQEKGKRMSLRRIIVLIVTWIALGVPTTGITGSRSQRLLANDAAMLHRARQSIRREDLRQHVNVLSDDSFEGREAGSRGGRAVGVYLREQLERHHLVGGGAKGGFFQPFSNGYRNILALSPGSDPDLRHEMIVISAHYDHVGYGSSQNSYGPIGRIHNGADDNASGTAVILELAEAFSQLNRQPRRSVLFALWDGEEKGLLGSIHWVAHPLPTDHRINFLVNMDMVGRLRNNEVIFYGTRTQPGLRRLVSEQNREGPMRVDFTWEMPDNSDHWPFFQRGIPLLMAHTGLHDDYHRPSDDAELVNVEGMEHVSRLLFNVVHELADRPASGPFRAKSRDETVQGQRRSERGLPALKSRLGVRWAAREPHANQDADTTQDAAITGLRLTQVRPASAAARAGLKPGDLLVACDGRPIDDVDAFRKRVLAARKPLLFSVQRDDASEPIDLEVRLDGRPLRLGISWRFDDAEPRTLIVSRVVPGSAAALAGLQLNDRMHLSLEDAEDAHQAFMAMVEEAGETLNLTLERQGRTFDAEIHLPPLDREITSGDETTSPAVRTPETGFPEPGLPEDSVPAESSEEPAR
jgi:hypothetical protein